MTRAKALLGVVFSAGVAFGCAGAKSSGARAEAAANGAAPTASVADAVIDERRDVILRMSPRELVRDPVYGPLVTRGLEAALEHARARGAPASTLEILSRAEDVVVAVRDREGRDAVAIASGVPQGRTPSELVDDLGKPIFSPLPSVGGGRVQVYGGVALEQKLRLYELAGGTWMLGVGRGAERIERSLARGEAATYAPNLHASAALQLAGELLAALKARAGPALRPVARGLDAATLTLGKHVRDPSTAARARLKLDLVYRDERQAEAAEPTASRAAALMSERVGWPGTPLVTRKANVVSVEIAIESKLE